MGYVRWQHCWWLEGEDWWQKYGNGGKEENVLLCAHACLHGARCSAVGVNLLLALQQGLVDHLFLCFQGGLVDQGVLEVQEDQWVQLGLGHPDYNKTMKHKIMRERNVSSVNVDNKHWLASLSSTSTIYGLQIRDILNSVEEDLSLPSG